MLKNRRRGIRENPGIVLPLNPLPCCIGYEVGTALIPSPSIVKMTKPCLGFTLLGLRGQVDRPIHHGSTVAVFPQRLQR